MELARVAVGASKSPWSGYIDTLAAALAESGNYPEAISEQRRAIDSLTESDVKIRAEIQARLELYLSG